MIELTCVKNNKGRFIAFGFLYVFIQRNNMTDYNIFLPVTLSNDGIELGYVQSLYSHDYNIAIKNHYEKMMSLIDCSNLKNSSHHSIDYFQQSIRSIYQNWINIIHWSNACIKQKELDELYQSKYDEEYAKLKQQEDYVKITKQILLQEFDYENHLKSNLNDKHELFKLKSKLDWLKNELFCLEDKFRTEFQIQNQHLLSKYKAKPSDNQLEIVARMCF